MKNKMLLACLTMMMFSCNDNSNSHTIDADSPNHPAGNNANTKKTTTVNPITGNMDKMMQEMHGTKATGNNDIDFATMMLLHHKAAVEMSKVEVDKGNNAKIKAFAHKVIADQNKEISFMQKFIAKAPKNTSSNSTLFKEALNGSMMKMMSNDTPVYNDIDKDFAAQMVPHHQSAVDMANVYLEYGTEKSLRTMCKHIIASQTNEISWLKEWQTKNKQ